MNQYLRVLVSVFPIGTTVDTCTCALHFQLLQDSSVCPCAPTSLQKQPSAAPCTWHQLLPAGQGAAAAPAPMSIEQRSQPWPQCLHQTVLLTFLAVFAHLHRNQTFQSFCSTSSKQLTYLTPFKHIALASWELPQTLLHAQSHSSAHLIHAQAYHSVFGMAPPSMGQGLLPPKELYLASARWPR